MALCRCKQHPPKSLKYVSSVMPVGYPNTSSICGRPGCDNPGMIYLTNEEVNLFNNGQQIFSYATNTSKVKVLGSI